MYEMTELLPAHLTNAVHYLSVVFPKLTVLSLTRSGCWDAGSIVLKKGLGIVIIILWWKDDMMLMMRTMMVVV